MLTGENRAEIGVLHSQYQSVALKATSLVGNVPYRRMQAEARRPRLAPPGSRETFV